MEELAKALAEVIRAGSALAPSVVVGYYVTRIVEAIAVPLGFVAAVVVITRCAAYGMNRWACVDEKKIEHLAEPGSGCKYKPY